MFAFDLETTFLQTGRKRHETIILSIGAISLLDDRTFHCFLKPTDTDNEKEFYDDLALRGVRIDATKNVVKKIEYDVRTAITAKKALRLFHIFLGQKPILIAHNGKSFDFKILQGSLDRNNETLDFVGLDSYHGICKKVLHMQSYKLSHVYFALVNKQERLKFHTALDDSKALKQITIICCFRLVAKHLEDAFDALHEVINSTYNLELNPERGLCREAKQLLKQALKQHESVPKNIKNKIVEYAIKRFINKNT